MKKIDFTPTKAIQSMVGDHQASGKRFDLMATFEAKDDGKWCIVAIEDSPMPGYGKDEEKGDKQPEQKDSKFMETYEKARSGQMESGSNMGGGGGGY